MPKQIIFRTPPRPIPQTNVKKTEARFKKSSYGGNILAPVEGIVTKRSGRDSVDVTLSNGLKLKNVHVASSRWVMKTSGDLKAIGHKDLPPEKSKVVIIFPYGTIEHALIICSAFDATSKDQQAHLLKSDELSLEIDIDEYGWKTTKDKDHGKITLESPDLNSEAKQFKIVIDVENQSFVITHQITTGKVNKITSDNNGVKIQDQNGNTFEMGTTSVKINNNLEILQ